jgi:group I intron endonuclease
VKSVAREIISGIYAIIHNASGRIYVGSALNIEDRWRVHRGRFKYQKHENKYLQHAWDKYGEEAFTWTIIEVVTDTTKLLNKEQKWINKYKSYNRRRGFNIARVAGNTRKITDTECERIYHRHEAGERMHKLAKEFGVHAVTISRALQRLSWKENGRPHTYNRHGNNNPRAKLTTKDVETIRTRLSKGERPINIAKDYSVHKETIAHIRDGIIWKSI